jgi:hypothetical protein
LQFNFESSDGLRENAILRVGGSPADSSSFGANTNHDIKMDEHYWGGIAVFAQ